LNKRMRRMYVFLNQFKLNIVHVPGCRNELCDFLSRSDFENKFQIQFEEAAKEAFQRMDCELDLFLQRIFSLSHNVSVNEEMYLDSDLKEIWESLEVGKSALINSEVWLKTKGGLFCEGKLAIPHQVLRACLHECHKSNNHPGAERTLLFFLSHFHSTSSKRDLLEVAKTIVMTSLFTFQAKSSN